MVVSEVCLGMSSAICQETAERIQLWDSCVYVRLSASGEVVVRLGAAALLVFAGLQALAGLSELVSEARRVPSYQGGGPWLHVTQDNCG